MIERLITSYLKYLAEQPYMLSAIIIWSVVTYGSWLALWIYRKDIIEGLKGINGKFEGTEVLLFIVGILIPPVVMYSVAFHYDIPVHTLIFMGGSVIVGVFGRWGLEWIGNMWNRKGNPETLQVTTETTTETTIK